MVHTTLPLSALEHLSISTRDPALLPIILPHVPRLVDLRVATSVSWSGGVEDRHSAQISEALCMALGQSSSLLCRCLHTLALQSCWGTTPGVLSPPSLIDIAITRERLGCRLRRMIIQRSRYRKTEDEPGSRQLFADAFMSLDRHVDEVVLLAEGRPGAMDTGRVRPEWAMPEAERYWKLGHELKAPERLW